MATSALTARLPFLVARPKARATVGAAFDELGGPVVAVCGLTGGAGSTTLALLLAKLAAEANDAPVLVTEARPGRGLALLAGQGTPHSLQALAARAAQGEAPAGAFAELAPGLRLVATADRRPRDMDAPVGALVEQARVAHGLVVVDCGTTWLDDDSVLACATRRVWVFPATPAGVATARATLPSGAATAVAVGRDPHASLSVRAVRRAVRGRCDRLVLVPYSEEIARGGLSPNEAIAHALTAIATPLRSGR